MQGRAAELRMPEREAEGLLNWAAMAKVAAAGVLIGTRRQAQGASLRRPRCRRRIGTMSGVKARVRVVDLYSQSQPHLTNSGGVFADFLGGYPTDG